VTARREAGMNRTALSFDMVSEVGLQEVRNAVDQANREIGTRFDFKGVDARFELVDDLVRLQAEQELQQFPRLKTR
jgi:uncharacterized protein YajQ (UPF0234 family)